MFSTIETNTKVPLTRFFSFFNSFHLCLCHFSKHVFVHFGKLKHSQECSVSKFLMKRNDSSYGFAAFPFLQFNMAPFLRNNGKPKFSAKHFYNFFSWKCFRHEQEFLSRSRTEYLSRVIFFWTEYLPNIMPPLLQDFSSLHQWFFLES